MGSIQIDVSAGAAGVYSPPMSVTSLLFVPTPKLRFDIMARFFMCRDARPAMPRHIILDVTRDGPFHVP